MRWWPLKKSTVKAKRLGIYKNNPLGVAWLHETDLVCFPKTLVIKNISL
jgi:hypothetical protein